MIVGILYIDFDIIVCLRYQGNLLPGEGLLLVTMSYRLLLPIFHSGAGVRESSFGKYLAGPGTPIDEALSTPTDQLMYF